MFFFLQSVSEFEGMKSSTADRFVPLSTETLAWWSFEFNPMPALMGYTRHLSPVSIVSRSSHSLHSWQ